MSNINYLRQLINGSPSTIDLLVDGTYLNLYGIKFKSGSNPSIQNFKPLRIGVSGYVETGLIDLANESSVSGNVDWHSHTIINLADASLAQSPATLNQLDYVSGVIQSQINAITSDSAWEWTEVVSGGGQTIFDVTPRTFSASSSVYDIQVYRNNGKLNQNVDFTKLDDHRIQTNVSVPQYSRITVREERTGGTGGGGGGGTTDLTLIDVDPQPDTDGLRTLGGTRAWNAVIFRDQVSGSHYSLGVSGGILMCSLVP